MIYLYYGTHLKRKVFRVVFNPGQLLASRLIGDPDRGTLSPTVHVNKLKYIPPRSTNIINQSTFPKPKKTHPKENFCDIFLDLNNADTNTMTILSISKVQEEEKM